MARRSTGVTATPRGRWIARYRDADRKPHSKTFDRQADAVAWRTQQVAAVRAGTWSAPALGKVTVRDYAEQWLAGGAYRARTHDLYRRRLMLHIYPTFGDRPIRDLRHSELRTWLSRLEREYRPWTVYGIHSMFRTMLNSAVADRVRVDTPFASIKLKSVRNDPVVPLTVQQVQVLCEAAPERYRALFVLAAATGMRGGELMGLDLSAVDFLRRTIRVERQLVHAPSGDGTTKSFAFGPPKTEASRRTVEVPQYALNALAAHLQRWPTAEMVLPVVDTPGTKERATQLVFTSSSGRPLHRSGVAVVWHSARRRAGLPDARGGMHALRHHVASLLIDAGESVKVVQAQLGHATAAETWDTYAHLFPSNSGSVRGVLERAWEPAASEVETHAAP